MTKLTIIISYNNQPDQIVSRTLSSIDLQQGIDFKELEIFICGSNKNLHEFDISSYYNIKSQIKFYLEPSEYSCAGASINIGLNHLKSRWFFIMDMGDVLHNCVTLSYFLRKENGFPDDVAIIYSWVEESPSGFYTHPITANEVYTHGKIYNTKRLNEFNIRCVPYLHCYNDTVLNLSYMAIAANHTITNTDSLYVWLYDKNSVSRSNNNESVFGNYDTYLAWDCILNNFMTAKKLSSFTEKDNPALFKMLRFELESMFIKNKSNIPLTDGLVGKLIFKYKYDFMSISEISQEYQPYIKSVDIIKSYLKHCLATYGAHREFYDRLPLRQLITVKPTFEENTNE